MTVMPHLREDTMSKLKVLVESGVCEIDGRIDGAAVVVSSEALEAALGWHLKPEGLCKGDICMPVGDRASIMHANGVNLVAVAHLLGSETLVDPDSSIVAVSVPAQSRHQALIGRQAADFTLPDLDGNLHSLNDFAGHRRLLVAFATW